MEAAASLHCKLAAIKIHYMLAVSSFPAIRQQRAELTDIITASHAVYPNQIGISRRGDDPHLPSFILVQLIERLS
jgi:hypothetical protein